MCVCALQVLHTVFLMVGYTDRQADHKPNFFFQIVDFKQVLFYERNLVESSVSPDVSLHSASVALPA